MYNHSVFIIRFSPKYSASLKWGFCVIAGRAADGQSPVSAGSMESI